MRLTRLARLPVALLLVAGLTLALAPGTLRPAPVHANTILNSTVCGPVSGYVAASPGTAGYVVLGSVVYPLAPGSTLINANLIASGANLCLQANYNSSGQIVYATLSLNAPAAVSVCGTLAGFVPATAVNTGVIVVNGTLYPIAVGVVISGLSADGAVTSPTVCLQASLNSLGQIIVGAITSSSIPGGVGQSLDICGLVTAYTPATSISTGIIAINGQTYVIAAGVVLTGAFAVTTGINICLTGNLNSLLQIVSVGMSSNSGVSLITCGPVSSFTAAGASSVGSITFTNNQTYAIAPGTILAGTGLITGNTNLCLNASLNSAGQINGGALTLNGSASLTTTICGVVTAYTPTSNLAGSITIGGTTYAILAGANFGGAGVIASGTNVCIQVTLNSAGQIVSGAANFNGGVQVNVCGVLSAYTPATGAAGGTITIAGVTFPIGAGASFTGSGTLTAGAILGVNLALDGMGNVSGGIVTASSCSGSTLVGPVSAYVPATLTTVGSITIAGHTYPVAAGTVLTVGNGPPLSARPFHGSALAGLGAERAG